MTRHVQHAHHLKGLLRCGTCGSRMLLDFAANPRALPTPISSALVGHRSAPPAPERAVPVAVNASSLTPTHPSRSTTPPTATSPRMSMPRSTKPDELAGGR